MQRMTDKERAALRWGAILFVLFWVAVIIFRIVAMASDVSRGGQFT